MSQEWKLNDAVYIKEKSSSSSSSSQLQGVIAFLGPVSFAEGDDWVGVRLTGTSVGQGKNNGTVKDVKYFDCASGSENGGMFVKKSALKKRILTRLEELRLKRELKGAGGGTSASSVASSSSSIGGLSSPGLRRTKVSNARRSVGGGTGSTAAPADDDDDSSVSSMSSFRSTATGATTGTNRSRLDEIRSRRMAIQRNNSSKAAITSPAATRTSRRSAGTTAGTTGASTSAAAGTTGTTTSAASTPRASKTRASPNPTPASAAASSASSSSRRRPSPSTSTSATPSISKTVGPNKIEIENNHLKTKIDILTDKLQSTEEEKNTIQSNLNTSAKEVHELKFQMNELKASIEVIQQNADKKIASAVAAADAATAAAESIRNDDDNAAQLELQQLRNEIENLQATNSKLSQESKDEKEQMTIKFQMQITSIQESFEQELSQKESENASLQKQLSTYDGKISVLEKNLNEREEKAALREDHDSAHYKERAKLQADILSWTRKVTEVAREKLEMELTLEELTLDKESLQERCEEMEDLLDELKIDAESAQIEVEESRFELESARARAEKAEAALALGNAGGGDGGQGAGANGDGSSGATVDAEDVAQALSIQNARLREAIIRLREQTAFEKMEMTKQLRAGEKDSEAVAGLKEELAKLLTKEKTYKREVNELKEMVDQGSAFEQMVEELSDRVLVVEDNNIALQCDIRELEEAAELNAEMEEAQADEIKALMKELQNRDTVVVNLEEAIKMQRRRELDFQRTVGNYRKTIDTLQQEKNSLLALHAGDEGEKKNALMASQKALAQAAQSVADASAARKREANATFNLIDAKVKSHLAERLESFLPQNVASSEISAVKGELLLSKIAMKASLSLNSLTDIFKKTINTANTAIDNMGSAQKVDVEKMVVTSNLLQKVGTVIHQTKFTQLGIDTSSECLRLLSLSQWPEILSSEASTDFSIAISHTIPQLDSAISEQLLKLKQEGVLSPHQSNLNILSQALQSVRLSLDSIVDADDKPFISPEWNPPSLEVFGNVSSAKFACLGTASVLASIVETEDVGGLDERCSFISNLLIPMNNICNEISTITDTLACLDITNVEVFESLSKIASELKSSSWDIFTTVEMLFSGKEVLSFHLDELVKKAQTTSSSAGKFLTLLRSHKIDDIEESKYESLSPEISDPWEAVKSLARKVKNTTGDADEINYLIRGKALEEQLSVAVENDAKLSIANSKIRSLEKNLTTRSKEISMQNGRLHELESMLSQTAITPAATARSPAVISQPTEDSQELKEEVRILNEAMEVLQTQVDEYEREIRTLKDPQKGKSRRSAPGSGRKSTSLDTDFSLANLGVGTAQKAPLQDIKSGLVEAALFRPALRSARSDASVWKSKAIVDILQKLPALSAIPKVDNSEASSQRQKLWRARTELRNRKANISIIDLNDGIDSSLRLQLKDERKKTAFAMGTLQEVSSSIQFMLCSKVM